MKDKAEEYRTETIQIGNATICIHRPILTDAERAKVEENIVSALSQYGRAVAKLSEN